MKVASPAAGLSQLHVQRLVLPKYLFEEAQLVMQRSDLYAHALATSLLQDAVETYLRLVVDVLQLDVGARDHFDKLLDAVAKRVPAVAGYRSTLGKLNSARVAFKHHGLSMPSEMDAKNFAANVRDLFEEATHDLLGVDFRSVSLIDAIPHRRTKNWLWRAQRALDESRIDDALQGAAKAFAVYLAHSRSTEARMSQTQHGTLFGFRTSLAWLHVDERHPSLVEGMTRWLTSIEDRVDLMARGVDTIRHEKFARLTPNVTFSMAGTMRLTGNAQSKPSADEARFCIQFVTDATLALQRSHPVNDSTSTGGTATVIRKCAVLAPLPEPGAEVIREADVGEVLSLPDRSWSHVDRSGYIAVLQDGDVAYAREDSVDIASDNE